MLWTCDLKRPDVFYTILNLDICSETNFKHIPSLTMQSSRYGHKGAYSSPTRKFRSMIVVFYQPERPNLW